MVANECSTILMKLIKPLWKARGCGYGCPVCSLHLRVSLVCSSLGLSLNDRPLLGGRESWQLVELSCLVIPVVLAKLADVPRHVWNAVTALIHGSHFLRWLCRQAACMRSKVWWTKWSCTFSSLCALKLDGLSYRFPCAIFPMLLYHCCHIWGFPLFGLKILS